MHPTLELAVTICPELTLLGGRLGLLWHPASSSIGVVKKKPHEIYTFLENFGKIAPKSCEYGVNISYFLANRSKFTGLAGTSEFLLAKVSILPLPVASSPDSAFLYFPQIQLSPLKKTTSVRQAQTCPWDMEIVLDLYSPRPVMRQ